VYALVSFDATEDAVPGPIRTDRLRMLHTPRPIAVQADMRGVPVTVRLPRRRGFGTELRAEHTRVDLVQDQWRIDDEWWRKEISRMYFAVVLVGGQQETIFQDLLTGRWYLQTAARPVARVQPLDVLVPRVPEPGQATDDAADASGS
jgi:hypothetical protein